MAKIAAVKGTRDFYPDQMRFRNWLFDKWRAASLRNGFEEYDAPIFEHLQLYTQKSGDEIVSQLFNFTDRGDRQLAIRPEITPTLARMVNQQVNALPRPIKWFSIPRLCRAERPQKGRLREFFQWNVDVVGSDAVLADAECIYTALDFLRSVKLGAEDVVVKLSSRSMLAEVLLAQGFAAEQLDSVYVLLDKRAKVSHEGFAEMVAEQIPDEGLRDKLMAIQACDSLEAIEAFAVSDAAQENLEELRKLFGYLELMGVGGLCEFDIKIVRGLAYYTGPVFEIYDRASELRALCGGGRYDNLLAGLGGPKVPATGFGMGDVVLEILLQESDRVPELSDRLDAFVITADKELQQKALGLVCQLREAGLRADISYKNNAIGKQFKQAGAQRADRVILLGEETLTENKVTVKDMREGSQAVLGLDELVEAILS